MMLLAQTLLFLLLIMGAVFVVGLVGCALEKFFDRWEN